MHTFFYLHNLPYALFSLFLRRAVCLFHFSSFARRWNCTDSAILLYFIKLWDFAVCLPARPHSLVSVSFRHRGTPFHPLLFIFVTMNCKAMYIKTFLLLHLVFFRLRLLHSFVFFFIHFFLFSKSIYHSFIVGAAVVVVFKYTQLRAALSVHKTSIHINLILCAWRENKSKN